MIYLDACYIAKFYLAEPDSQSVIDKVASVGACGCSIHGRIEVQAAFHRKLREGVMSRDDLNLLTEQFDRDCESGLWSWFPFESDVVRKTVDIIRRLPGGVYLRAGDAIHLSCASQNGFAQIYSSDRHLLAAAEHFSLAGIRL